MTGSADDLLESRSVMPLADQHLLATVRGADLLEALASWRWLIGDDKEPLLLTLSGDVFLRDARGGVYWLETGGGELQKVADTEVAFESAWSDAQRRDEWLLGGVIDALLESGRRPVAGQCFGYRVSPALGGAYDGENRILMSAREHVDFSGYLHARIADLPDGSEVTFEIGD